jgi:LPXTG-site transpeptidase (sortase) family protein
VRGGAVTSAAPPSTAGSVSRFAARVLMVSGALLLMDAGTTLAWQEPISALLTARAQPGLEQQLDSAPVRTDQGSLRKGPGHYPDIELPGQSGTVGIAGHRTTYLAPFRTIDQLDRGAEIVVDMPYARFTYRVQKQEIVEPTQTEVVDDVGYPRLVMSACHPLYSAAQRIIVFARLDEVRPA